MCIKFVLQKVNNMSGTHIETDKQAKKSAPISTDACILSNKESKKSDIQVRHVK